MNNFIDLCINNIIKIILQFDSNDIIDKFANIKNKDIFKQVDYLNLEKIPQTKTRGRIIISNHNSLLDYIIIKNHIECYCVANISSSILEVVSKDEFLNKYNIICYDYISGNEIKNKILELINSGINVLVFPEGYTAREIDKNIPVKPFKKGLFHLAYDNNIEILPITQNHHNATNSYYFDSSLQSFILNLPVDNLKVDVVIDDLIKPSDYSSFEEFYETCFSKICENLNLLKKLFS